MKYALIDDEIHHRQREDDTFWPLSLAEAQHVVDTMNMVSTAIEHSRATSPAFRAMSDDILQMLKNNAERHDGVDSDDKPE